MSSNNHEAIVVIPSPLMGILGPALIEYFGSQVMVVSEKPDRIYERLSKWQRTTKAALLGKPVLVIYDVEKTASLMSIRQQLNEAKHLRQLGTEVLVWSTLEVTTRAFPQSGQVKFQEVANLNFTPKEESLQLLLANIAALLQLTMEGKP